MNCYLSTSDRGKLKWRPATFLYLSFLHLWTLVSQDLSVSIRQQHKNHKSQKAVSWLSVQGQKSLVITVINPATGKFLLGWLYLICPNETCWPPADRNGAVRSTWLLFTRNSRQGFSCRYRLFKERIKSLIQRINCYPVSKIDPLASFRSFDVWIVLSSG